MAWLLGVAVLGALGALAVARYASSPIWLDALVATGGFIGLALALAAAIALRRALARWRLVTAVGVGVAAVAARAVLLAEILASASGPRAISFWRLCLAASSVVWGALALIWGTAELAEALDEPRRRWRALLVSAAATSAALYALAPLWHLLGLRINYLTVLGLFGLAAVAWLLGAVWRRLAPSDD